MKTEEEKTKAVSGCKSFEELELVVKTFAPFISGSREQPVTWNTEDLLRRIDAVKKGHDIINVTRANGLRDKVKELSNR